MDIKFTIERLTLSDPEENHKYNEYADPVSVTLSGPADEVNEIIHVLEEIGKIT